MGLRRPDQTMDEEPPEPLACGPHHWTSWVLNAWVAWRVSLVRSDMYCSRGAAQRLHADTWAYFRVGVKPLLRTRKSRQKNASRQARADIFTCLKMSWYYQYYKTQQTGAPADSNLAIWFSSAIYQLRVCSKSRATPAATYVNLMLQSRLPLAVATVAIMAAVETLSFKPIGKDWKKKPLRSNLSYS